MIPVIENMTDEHYILMQTDYFINRTLELDKIAGFGPVPYVNLYSRGKVELNEMNKVDPQVLKNMFDLRLIRDDWKGWN